jgi:predicted small lipoprotein YifL
MSTIWRLTAIMLVILALAGCGKKGPHQPPPGVPNTFPQTYPAQ